MARIAADPQKRAEFLLKDRLRKQKKGQHETVPQHEPIYVMMQNEPKEEPRYAMTQHEPRQEPKWCADMPCMLPLCHLSTAVVAGPTGCGKTAWVLRLIDNARQMIEPLPTRIWYYYGEHQPAFNNYPWVHFEEGLPQLNDEVFDDREPSMIVLDNYMSDANQLVADIFTTISHHRNISILQLTQNLFDKNKFARTISLNAHYLLLFNNPRDAGQFAVLARQMYPNLHRYGDHSLRNCTHSVGCQESNCL